MWIQLIQPPTRTAIPQVHVYALGGGATSCRGGLAFNVQATPAPTADLPISLTANGLTYSGVIRAGQTTGSISVNVDKTDAIQPITVTMNTSTGYTIGTHTVALDFTVAPKPQVQLKRPTTTNTGSNLKVTWKVEIKEQSDTQFELYGIVSYVEVIVRITDMFGTTTQILPVTAGTTLSREVEFSRTYSLGTDTSNVRAEILSANELRGFCYTPQAAETVCDLTLTVCDLTLTASVG
jgi:hypothetical protein